MIVAFNMRNQKAQLSEECPVECELMDSPTAFILSFKWYLGQEDTLSDRQN